MKNVIKRIKVNELLYVIAYYPVSDSKCSMSPSQQGAGAQTVHKTYNDERNRCKVQYEVEIYLIINYMPIIVKVDALKGQ